MKRIYLDYAAITPMDPRVLKAMTPYLKEDFANPSAIYQEGVKMKKVLEESRKTIAKILGAHSDEIIFTSGGTEANNLAILGTVKASAKKIKKPHIITSVIEHPSILVVCRELERSRLATVTYLKVSGEGRIDPKDVKKALKPNTVLVSIMYSNNEIGTIEPVREIAKAIRHFKKENKRLLSDFPYFHTDASQAANFLDLNVERLGVDLVTIDATKIYGPRGAGFLYCRRGRELEAILFGGDQEKGKRAGTENLPAAVGLSAALQLSDSEKLRESKRLAVLRDYFLKNVFKNIPQASLNSAKDLSLPNIVNICIPGLDAEFAVLRFDAKGIAISSVTSCQNLQEDSSSEVVRALGKAGCDKSSLRFSFGRRTTKIEIDYCLKVLYNIINGRTL